MGRSQETFNKKNVRSKKEKKRKEKEKRRQEKREQGSQGNFDDMIAYVDENGQITSERPDPNKKKETKLKDIEIGIPKKTQEEEIDAVHTGKVYYYNPSKGFAFIRDQADGNSIFIHISQLPENVGEGSLLNFEIEAGPRGPVAINAKLIT